ncbi:MAG TPA: hypothetical protein VFV92_04810 [Candidatus Bathyarchaeia archaeon]|nr:hypothetical protein [Candidatus Bathyarchaeia archaeon]
MAVDFSDPIVWSTIVQTIVLTLTLVIFTFSFRSQNRAIREQAYERVMDDYGDALRLLLEKPELYQFQADLFNRGNRSLGGEQRSFTREDLAIRNFVVMMYGFFERVHFLYRRKWIDEPTWKQWAAFLAVVADHPVFRDVHQSSAEMFDKEFVDYVSSILPGSPQKAATTSRKPS